MGFYSILSVFLSAILFLRIAIELEQGSKKLTSSFSCVLISTLVLIRTIARSKQQI
jgi:hypothetical protein